MKFKPAKSRSIALKKGKIHDRFRFKINGEDIPTVTEQPVKSLGKWFRSSLSDKDSVTEMRQQCNDWIKTVGKNGLPGKFKAWIYQHGVLPRLLWPLLVYDVPISKVEAMEEMLNGDIRRWLVVPKSISSIGLYSPTSKLKLPLSSVTEEFKVTKVRQAMIQRDKRGQEGQWSSDRGEDWCKCRADKVVNYAEARLRHSDLVGTTTTGRLGLRCVTRSCWIAASLTEKRQLVQKDFRVAEEKWQAAAVAMKKQGSWLRCGGIVQARNVSWNDMLKMYQHRIGFLLHSVYDVLPTPTNLPTWNLTEDPSCKLCDRLAKLEHVLCSCSTALADGRYRWRHDKILREIAANLDAPRRKKHTVQSGPTFIKFVNEGGSANPTSHRPTGILATAKDWDLQVDLKRQLKFPSDVALIRLRPDIVLLSRVTKQLVLLELTVPWEKRMQEKDGQIPAVD